MTRPSAQPADALRCLCTKSQRLRRHWLAYTTRPRVHRPSRRRLVSLSAGSTTSRRPSARLTELDRRPALRLTSRPPCNRAWICMTRCGARRRPIASAVVPSGPTSRWRRPTERPPPPPPQPRPEASVDGRPETGATRSRNGERQQPSTREWARYSGNARNPPPPVRAVAMTRMFLPKEW